MVTGISKIENVTFHDLYESYPEMDIDIDEEQRLMEENDCIVFHHPMYWYSAPAIFKEWQDLVLEYSWAYGSRGNALKGKLFFNTTTTGAAKSAFQHGDFQDHTVQEFFVPFKQMATLCKMIPIPPFVIHGTHIITEERLLSARRHYHKVLTRLAQDDFELEELQKLNYLNDLIKE